MDVEVAIAHLEEREKSNTKRLNEHDEQIKELQNTYTIMEKMDYRMSNMENNVSEIKEDIQKGKEQKERDKSRNPIGSIYRIPNEQNSSSVVIHT